MLVRDKINARMDELQRMMETELHLSDPNAVAEQIASVSKFWSVLTDEDRDYIHGAQYALEEQSRWSINEKRS